MGSIKLNNYLVIDTSLKMDGEILANNYKRVDEQIKQMNKKVRDLRVKRNKIGEKLHSYAVKRGYSDEDEYCGIPVKKLVPRTFPNRKTEKQRRKDGINYLKMLGTPNAEVIYENFKRAEKEGWDEGSE